MSEEQFLIEMAERCFQLARKTDDVVAVTGLAMIGQAMLLRAQDCARRATADLDLEFVEAADNR